MTDLIIPTPEQFFNQVTALNDKLAVNQACNELLDTLVVKYTVGTISKELSKYKKPFYAFQHNNSEFNETVVVKGENKIQHIAARLLTLSDEQKQALETTRNERNNARAGINEEGDVRDVEITPIDIEATIKKSCECLGSFDPHIIGAGIINLTGLRANEQNMPTRKYEKWDLIVRDMVVIDEYVIAFKGLSKKSSELATNAYYVRATLAPAKLIVEAHKRFLSCKAVQAITGDYEQYRKGFMDTFYNRYQELFGRDLSTIEAYDDDSNLINANGTPHKGRAFYACALRAILPHKNFKGNASITYIQRCLAHEKKEETIKYLGRYDIEHFINPVDINIPTNVKGLGIMNKAPIALLTPAKTTVEVTTPVEATTAPTETHVEVKEVKAIKTPAKKSKPAPKNTLDIDAFINALDEDLQVKFAELMSKESSLTNALIAIVNAAKEKGNINTNINPITTKKITVTDEVNAIANAIMTYNKEQTTVTNRIVPTYSLINKIAEKCLNKSIAKKTVDAWLETNTELQNQLTSLDIPENTNSKPERERWNGKYHRKTLDNVIDSIITVFNKG